MTRRLRFSIFVGMIACAVPVAAAAQVDYIDPAGGFTQVVTTTNAGVKTIFVSGQVGRGDTLRAHVESAFAGVVRRLEQAGATPADVVKIRIFVKDFEPAQYGVISEVRLATFPDADHWPASTMIGVPGAGRRRVARRDRGDCGRGRAGRRARDRAFRAGQRLQRGGGRDGERRQDRLRGRPGRRRRDAGGADGGRLGARRHAPRRGGGLARGPDQGHHLHRRLRSGDGPGGVPRGP